MEININNSNNDNNKERLKCRLFLCVYNTACCAVPRSGTNNYCKKTNKASVVGHETLYIPEENKVRDTCKNYITDKNKKLACIECQLDEYGEISIPILELDPEEIILENRKLKKKMQSIIEDGDDFLDE